MNHSKTEQYLLGMDAINNFFAMLYKALTEATKSSDPNAKISKSGAYVWRGYQITKYHDLAPNHYYFQICPWDPFKFTDKDGCLNITCRELIFQEGYYDPKLRQTNNPDFLMRINDDRYHYPFHVSLDLYRSRFFLMDVDEQYAQLFNFVTYALQQALIWQHSQVRSQVTSPEFINGGTAHASKPKVKAEFHKVNEQFLYVWGTQHQLFRQLISHLKAFQSERNLQEKDWIRANSSYHNFEFRGYRMKSGKISPKDFDIRWLIYYDKPELLRCFTFENVPIKDFNLKQSNYFELTSDQQDQALIQFIHLCLDRF